MSNELQRSGIYYYTKYANLKKSNQTGCSNLKISRAKLCLSYTLFLNALSVQKQCLIKIRFKNKL